MHPRPIRQFKCFLVVYLLLIPATGLSQETPEEVESLDYTISYLDRLINLEPYLQGYPYGGWRADFKAGKLFYRHTTPEGTWMMVQDLQPGGGDLIDPEAGQRVTNVDLSTRSLGYGEFDQLSGDRIVKSNEKHGSGSNLYRLSSKDSRLTKLTEVLAVYTWNYSRDRKKIGYIARYLENFPYRNCLSLSLISKPANLQRLSAKKDLNTGCASVPLTFF